MWNINSGHEAGNLGRVETQNSFSRADRLWVRRGQVLKEEPWPEKPAGSFQVNLISPLVFIWVGEKGESIIYWAIPWVRSSTTMSRLFLITPHSDEGAKAHELVPTVMWGFSAPPGGCERWRWYSYWVSPGVPVNITKTGYLLSLLGSLWTSQTQGTSCPFLDSAKSRFQQWYYLLLLVRMHWKKKLSTASLPSVFFLLCPVENDLNLVNLAFLTLVCPRSKAWTAPL